MPKPKPKISTSIPTPTLTLIPAPAVHRKRPRPTLASADRASSVICVRASAEWRAWLEDTAKQAGLPGPLDLIDEALRSFAAAQAHPAGLESLGRCPGGSLRAPGERDDRTGLSRLGGLQEPASPSQSA